MVIDKSRLTTESQPDAFVKVTVAVLFDVVYVLPSIHVYEPQAVWISINELACPTVRLNVMVESQPVELVYVTDGLFVELAYVFPSIQVNGPHENWLSVIFIVDEIVKSNETIESQPAELVKVTVAVLFDEV